MQPKNYLSIFAFLALLPACPPGPGSDDELPAQEEFRAQWEAEDGAGDGRNGELVSID